MEFLVTLRQDWSVLRERADLVELTAAERRVGRELMVEGVLARIWRLPGQRANVGIWRAVDATDLGMLLARLPLWPWMSADIVPLAVHELEQEP